MNPNILSKKLNLNEESDVKLLIDHQENRAILSEYLKNKYKVSQSTSVENLEKADILIVDEAGLKAKNKEIIKLKRKKSQLFLPLLLLSRKSSDELSGQYLEIVDEIIEIPIKKRLLFSRIENLLNLRNLFLSTQIYQKLTENNPVGVCILQKNKEVKYVNNAFLEIVEKKKTNILNKNIEEIFSENNIEKYLDKDQEKSIIEIKLKDKKKWINIRSSEIMFKDTKLKILILIDISEQKKSEKKIRYLSFHDQLTGLYNRNYFMEEIDRLDTKRKLPITIIMADINNLKLINDIFGHDKGDQLIKKTADIFNNNIRESDILARIGGDEFAILLPQTSLKAGKVIIERIKKSCSDSEIMNIKIRMAMGAASKKNINQEINDIFKAADDRMYQDKNSTSKKSRKKIISSLNKNLKEKTDVSQKHIEEMEKLVLRLAEKLNLNKEQKNKLILLAETHDIGKISVEADLFKKNSSLAEKEVEKLKAHSEYGYRIAHSLPKLSSVAEEILTHHENWDGSGYPQGLKGEEIPFLARVIAVVDSYLEFKQDLDNEKKAKKEALEKLKSGAGTKFDPEIVKKFIDIL